MYCRKLSFCQNDPRLGENRVGQSPPNPPANGGSFWQKESLLHTIHYDSAPKPRRYCFANPNVHPSWPSQANDFGHFLVTCAHLKLDAIMILKCSDVVSGWVGWALAYPVFGSSVIPYSNQVGQIMPTTLLLAHPDLKI